jgi:hypothetical protein
MVSDPNVCLIGYSVMISTMAALSFLTRLCVLSVVSVKSVLDRRVIHSSRVNDQPENSGGLGFGSFYNFNF